ncbi:response regulator [Marinagarivorans cellulosilyticus]|uniref:Two-component system, sensor histidine kinase and response regulator n=1 Tax=Marinagarivorans cellulosilyticus TaxID=2721545 RepID=A0AAN1WKY7_9GAMM|nr:response regulator [Marinagarivorans cellulosilyticus]BCD99576.1 two-component system, sensor histidine kinase and response regulator [Marinagarivorans cellulosilyticus]
MAGEVSGKAILMVEDNADNADLATWMLEDADYDVTVAPTAEAGLALLNENSYAIILMDISLPGMDGKDAIRAIRDDPRIQEMPIIALTAHAVLNERDAIMASGANCIVTKPIDEDLLLLKLEEMIPS